LPYLKPHWGTIVQALCCTLVFTAVWPLLAWQAGKMLALLVQGDVPALARISALVGGIFLVQKLAQYGQDSSIYGSTLYTVTVTR
jgi:ATP-binding cassette subfamily B protein